VKDAKGHGSDPNGGKTVAQQYRAAHQIGIHKNVTNVLSAFLKNESGEGKIPDAAYDAALRVHDPDPSLLMHLSHFFMTIAAFAIVGALAQGLGVALS
jgi:hypothetical protein